MQGDVLAMSRKELTRLEVVQAVEARRMRQCEAAARLGLSVRQIKRLVRAYRCEGAAGLLSRRRGRPSNRRVSAQEREHFLGLLRAHYRDFGPTLAAEYLSAHHGFTRSAETLRGWMIGAGLWEAKKARRKRAHPARERRPHFGELIQIDGSPHDWFEGRAPRCCLIGFIDDATSALLWARFVGVESTRAYLAALGGYVARYGVPGACYSDRHSIFTKHDPEDLVPTQLERALGALGCEAIQATTPQAKGRIERVFQTLQDRLVKAMRLGGIASLEAGNTFLDAYLPEHNARFAQPPRAPEDAHLAWQGSAEALSRICAVHHERTLSRNLILSFRGQRYIVLVTEDRPRYRLRERRITVCEHLDGRIELLNAAESLPYRVFDDRCERPAPADEKMLNERVDKAMSQRPPPPAWKPPKSHPWKRMSALAGPPRPGWR